MLQRSQSRGSNGTATALPMNSAAEQGAISCLMLADSLNDADFIDAMLSRITGDHFNDLRHRDVLGTIRQMRRAKSTVNAATLRAELESHKLLDAVGGWDYLEALENFAPSALNFDEYLKLLEEMRQRRQTIEDARQMDKQARNLDVPITHIVSIVRASAQKLTEGATVKRRILFRKPSEIRAFNPPSGWRLIGDAHMNKGGISIIAGPPGIGKSRAVTELARRGADGCGEWLGLTVHAKFRSLIIQNENGLARLKQEYDALPHDLDDWVRVSEPPPAGMAFDHADFRRDLSDAIQDFKPQVVFVDPWNSVARDDGARDYREAWTSIQSALPTGDDAPHLCIVAHCRKPRDGERLHGRALLNTVAGHHVLVSVPRCVFVMEPASDDPEDARIIWQNVKNNDGQMTPRSAWMRTGSGFERCANFDWSEMDEPKGERVQITYEHMNTLFNGGTRHSSKKVAVEELTELAGCKESAAYNALRTDGRFSQHLTVGKSGLLTWKP